MANQYKGKHGERIAARYLEKRGFTILRHNWTCRWGELDLIAEKDSRIIVVEVKYRESVRYGRAHEALDFYKLKHLYRTIQLYLLQHKMTDVVWQLDLVCVTKLGQSFDLQHYPNLALE